MNKDFLLNESKTFCMFPWLHLNATPKGDVYPCCSNDYTQPVGNTKDNSLEEIFNSPKMKELRVDMLNEKKNSICDFCYKHEEAGPYSFRNYSKEQFANRFDEIVPTTQEDGTVDEFKMRYFDIRFSNICNFKCRTCGSEFSSKWGEEMRKNYDPKHPVLIHVDDNKGTVLDEVLEHIEHIDLAYFAGGEPLITDEHYTMLEAMIRKGRTDITLRYNTNASNIKYKKHDVLELWKHFKKIELSCSIDHYGERAEYMRKGTDWGVVENNLLTFRDLDYVSFQMNTVFSIYNYSTIGDFYQYLKDKNIVRTEDWYHSLYLAVHPNYYCAKSLPKELKTIAGEKALAWANSNIDDKTCVPNLVKDAVNFANDTDQWNLYREQFLMHTRSVDRIRGENFWKTFPELNRLQDLME
jgi:radical SAM protein with 4Fe4S-binding SPASM domain